jgi:hypothetical protein
LILVAQAFSLGEALPDASAIKSQELLRALAAPFLYGLPKELLQSVVAGFSLRFHRLEGLCHGGFLSNWEDSAVFK